MRIFSMVLSKNITSRDTDDVIPGKNKVSHAYREIRSKYYWIFMKISEYLYFSTGLCCIVFGENRNSLNIQNGGPKFSKFAYLSEISQFCSDFKTKYIFVINMII